VLFSALTRDGFYAPAAHGLRHPLIFYYAHPAALAVNKLRVAQLRDGPLNAHFERLFETGVDEMSWDDVVDAATGPQWPALETVVSYRAHARDIVLSIIRDHPALDAPLDEGDASRHAARWCLAMLCEHERIHLETSSVLMRELDLDYIAGRPAYWPPDHPSVAVTQQQHKDSTTTTTQELLAFRAVAGGVAMLGKPRSWPTFGWDNEYGARSIEVDAFEASPFVTNAQYLDFVTAGGYARPELWTRDGWAWRSFRNAKWPHFWVPRGPAGLHEYALRLPFEELDDLPGDLPAEVNAHEARAYAAWLQSEQRNDYAYRLMTEAETVVERHHAEGALESPDHEWAARESSALRSTIDAPNLNLAYGSPSAVDSAAPTKGGGGNVWQWCDDDFAALPGFRTHDLYDDFSTPCFDGEHSIIMGGSFASTGDEASRWARFHFRPHFHQHAGIRLTRQRLDARPPELTSHDAAPPLARGWAPPAYRTVLDAWTESQRRDAVTSTSSSSSSSSSSSARTTTTTTFASILAPDADEARRRAAQEAVDAERHLARITKSLRVDVTRRAQLRFSPHLVFNRVREGGGRVVARKKKHPPKTTMTTPGAAAAAARARTSLHLKLPRKKLLPAGDSSPQDAWRRGRTSEMARWL